MHVLTCSVCGHRVARPTPEPTMCSVCRPADEHPLLNWRVLHILSQPGGMEYLQDRGQYWHGQRRLWEGYNRQRYNSRWSCTRVAERFSGRKYGFGKLIASDVEHLTTDGFTPHSERDV